jgi:hypothetical protein
MSDLTGVEKVRSVLDGHAAACLDDLLRSGAPPRPGSAVLARGGWTVRVSVTPAPAADDPGAAPRLSECERDCLELLVQLHEPMSAARLRRALEERGVGVWAGITVKRALARLHRELHLIRNNRRGARGYWHPDAPSLFPRAAG